MDPLSALRERAAEAGIFLDFDGTLSEIVPLPAQSSPVGGALEVVGSLVSTYRLVAVISGRPADDVSRLLPVDGVRIEGLYGLNGDLQMEGLLEQVERAVSRVPEAWVESKGGSIAVHYRAAADPSQARRVLAQDLRRIAEEARGLDVIEGKMVLELVPSGRSRKGGAVEKLVREFGLNAALYAGDDFADLEAFEALERMAGDGFLGVKVAVDGEETPEELRARADVVVEGPGGLIEVLSHLL
ncbi:MAG: trehalose-phosphatase [Actinomycetota bacterium]